MPTKNCKIELSKVLLSLCTAKKQITNFVNLYKQLETFVLILNSKINSKIVLKIFFFNKVIDTKIIHYMHLNL